MKSSLDEGWAVPVKFGNLKLVLYIEELLGESEVPFMLVDRFIFVGRWDIKSIIPIFFLD